MSRIPSLRLATLAAAACLALAPVRAEAQKALVYCPVGIDAAGCNTIVAALAASSTLFPDGVDAGYDGTSGTVDLAGGDLSGYAVFVVPSLADGPDVQPYSLLRNGTIAGRIQSAFVGRVAVWSGTPDVGSTNRTAKDGLIRNLAAWAKADGAGTHGPGVVALQDNSDDEDGRYGWLGGISALSVTGRADPRGLLQRPGADLNRPGNPQRRRASDRLCQHGLVRAPGRDRRAERRHRRTLEPVGAGHRRRRPQRSDACDGPTDQEDYAPGETVIVTGTGWEPGETVSMQFHEDPVVHGDRTLTPWPTRWDISTTTPSARKSTTSVCALS